ncbi:hypothetical protein Micbo1qcDRAFT_158512, partial [Microdochium bolleyi]
MSVFPVMAICSAAMKTGSCVYALGKSLRIGSSSGMCSRAPRLTRKSKISVAPRRIAAHNGVRGNCSPGATRV